MERYIFLIIGGIGVSIILYWYIFKPIEKNRYLYGNQPTKMILCIAFAIISIFCLFSGICDFFGSVTSREIVNWDNWGEEFKYDSIEYKQKDSIIRATTQDIGIRELRLDSLKYEYIVKYRPNDDEAIEKYWAILSQFTDPGNLPSAHGDGRIIAFISALLGIIGLSGFLVSSLVNFLSRRAEKWRQGFIHYKYWNRKKYVVIIGVNDQTATIVKSSLARKGVDYVLIQTRQDVEKMRMRLDLSLDKHDENRVVFYYAERTSREDIEQLHLEKAVELYILGEDMSYANEEDHDAFNIDCLEHVSQYMKDERVKEKRREKYGKYSPRLRCHVNFEYQSTFTSFKATHIYQRLDKDVEFLPFNIHEIWAKKILVDNFAVVPAGKKGEVSVQQYKPLDGENGINPTTKKRVRLVIMGMNQMGTALAVQTALLAHYPNFKENKNLKTTITFIDDHAKVEGEYLRGRFEALFNTCCHRTVVTKGEKLEYRNDKDKPLFDDGLLKGPYSYLAEDGESFMDIDWEFIEGNVASNEIKDYLEEIVNDECNITTIAICFNHPQRSIATALYLPRNLYKKANQVLVYQQNSFDLLDNVANGEKDWKRYGNLYPFGMIESCYTGDAFDNTHAKLANYLFSKKKDPDIKKRLLSFDSSLIADIERTWDELGIVDKLSNIDMVDSIQTKIRSIKAHYEGKIYELSDGINKDKHLVECLSYSEHLRWVTERLVMGYRPLLEEEYNQVISGKETKESYKLNHRAHLDICSNEQLAKIDPESPPNDRNNIENIPSLLICSQWINVYRSRSHVGIVNSKMSLLRDFVGNKGKELYFKYVTTGKVSISGKQLNCEHPYWIADMPVTRWQWYRVTGKDKPIWFRKNEPVTDISKTEIEEFLLVLRKRTGLYFTLPNLKEWQYAAKKSTPYIKNTNKKWWRLYLCYNASGKRVIYRWLMSIIQNNPLQVYDMLGNVWEWTRTENKIHKDCFYFCGGSFRFKKIECDLNNDYWKTYWKPTLSSKDIGFRLIWKFDVKEEQAKALYDISTKENSQTELINSWINKDNRFVYVKGGVFMMGTEGNNNVRSQKDRPESFIDKDTNSDKTSYHFVKIKDFKLCSIPVTQEFWNIVMGDTAKNNPSPLNGDNLPQVNVSYRTIKYEFIPMLNKITKKKFRLPTEAEWEYAAKGGINSKLTEGLTKIFESGLSLEKKRDEAHKLIGKLSYFKYSGSNDAPKVAWINTNSIKPVNRKTPNELGLYDMSGNIWEWCEDFYQSDFHERCANSDEYQQKGYVETPCCLNDSTSAHVFRGGSWKFDAIDCRCTNANYWVDDDEDDDLGFRLILED